MIAMNWEKMNAEVGALVGAYLQLPGYIGKKHVVAALRRSIVKAKGPQLLRKNTPPVNIRRGRKKKSEKKRSTGELRRSVTVKGKWIGKTKGGWGVAGLGYKYGWNSRKAIWAEYGTKWQTGVAMMERTFESIRGPAAGFLVEELRKGLEKAAAELGKNPGMSRRGIGMGMGG